MSAKALLQNFIEKSLSHKNRIKSVQEACMALAQGCCLTVTSLGRHLKNGNKTKSNINKMHRLISSSQLHRDSIGIYRHANRELLTGISRPVISVDWTDANPSSHVRILSACVNLSGRGMVCYEKAFAKKLYNSQKAHNLFVKGLAQVLPTDCQPIIVTDAASSFGVIWFQLLEKMGWSWVGRVRKNHKYCYIEEELTSTAELYDAATKKIKHYPNASLTVKHQHPCKITTVKRPPKKTRKKSAYSTKRSHRHATAKHKKSGKEPWVLVSSPDLELSKKEIVHIYGTRMMIEERFRDTKDAHYGSGFLLSRSKDALELENLLLIDAITKFVLWMIGALAEAKGVQKEFQANTIKHRRVLSLVRLAIEIIFRNDRWKYPIRQDEYDEALALLRGYVVHV